MSTNGATSIWSRALSAFDDLRPAGAKALLDVRLKPRDIRRVKKLSELARRGALTPAQADELDTYLQIGSLLTIMHSKARVALKRRAGAVRPIRKSA